MAAFEDALARIAGARDLGPTLAELVVETCRSLPPATNGKYRLCYRA